MKMIKELLIIILLFGTMYVTGVYHGYIAVDKTEVYSNGFSWGVYCTSTELTLNYWGEKRLSDEELKNNITKCNNKGL